MTVDKPYIHIMYGAPFSGKTSKAKELVGQYIDFKTKSLYFDYTTVRTLFHKGLIIDGDIKDNQQLNSLLLKLVNHPGIEEYKEISGTYNIIIYYFDKDIDGNFYDIEYPKPSIPIISIKDKELKEEMESMPQWLKRVYGLRRKYGEGVSYLDKITSSKSYLYSRESTDEPHAFFELTDMLLKINPSMSLSVYKTLESHIKGEVQVYSSNDDEGHTYITDLDISWYVNLEDIAPLIPEWL